MTSSSDSDIKRTRATKGRRGLGSSPLARLGSVPEPELVEDQAAELVERERDPPENVRREAWARIDPIIERCTGRPRA